MIRGFRIVAGLTLFFATLCVFGADEPASPSLPLLSAEFVSGDSSGGWNLAKQVAVNPLTGDFYFIQTDLALPGPAGPVFQRFYRSSAPAKGDGGSFGSRWRSVFDRRLLPIAPDTYALADEWGATWLFARRADGRWWAKRGPARSLEATQEGFLLREADGLMWRFDAEGRLVAIGDRNGSLLRIERDRARPGIVTAVRGSDGTSIAVRADESDRIVSLESSDGRRVTYTYRGGFLVGVRPEGEAAIRYGYDDGGRLVEAAFPNGAVVTVRYDGQGRVLSLGGRGVAPRTYRYISGGGALPGEVVQTDGAGRVTRWRFAGGGRAVGMVHEAGGEVSIEYDERGRPLAMAFGKAPPWRWIYDDLGRLCERRAPTGEAVRYTYSGSRLRPDRAEYSDGSAIRFVLDGDERCTKVAAGNLEPWRFEYDSSGRIAAFEDFFHNRYSVAYDRKGRIVSLADFFGTLVRVGRDSKGRAVSFALRGGATIRLERDRAGRVVRLDDGVESLALEYNESGNVTSLAGSQGYLRRFYYAVSGLPSAIQRAGRRVHRIFYGAEGNCIGIRRPNGTAFHIGRGPCGWINLLDAAGLARWTVDFDAWARPVAYRKQGARSARVECDAAGRVTAVESPVSGRFALGYDPCGRIGALETPLRSFRFVFGPAGLLRSIVERATARRDAFEYDKDNRLVRRSTPGWTEEYEYDRAGRVRTFTVRDLSVHRFEFRYDDGGWLKEILYPNGARSSFDYDASHRLARASACDRRGHTLFSMPLDYATSSRLALAVGGGTDRFAYRYDSDLDIVEIAYPGGGRETYAYNALGDLASRTSPRGTVVFRYDALGRPVRVGAVRYVYLESRGRPPLPMTTSTVCLILDDREQVVELKRGDGLVAKYAYLPDGRMISREVGGKRFSFDWDGPRLRSVFDGHGRRLVSIYYEPAFGLPLAVAMGERTYYCHPDAFGRPAWLTNEKGEAVGAPDDFPFEAEDRYSPPVGPAWTGSPPPVRLREENLLLVRGMLCDPQTGKLLSSDISHFLDRLNPYRARRVPRPLEPTDVWRRLVCAADWIERIEKPRFRFRWCGEPSERLPRLAELLALVRRPEIFEDELLELAFRERTGPERWLDPSALGVVVGGLDEWPLLALGLPPEPALRFADFPPLGPVPYVGGRLPDTYCETGIFRWPSAGESR